MSQKRFLCYSHNMNQPSVMHQRPRGGAIGRPRGFLLPLLAVMLIAGVIVAGWCMLMWKWSYSDGERAGVVQKFSRSGWLCKTWEGELNMVVLPGALPEKFFFTTWDDAVAAAINRNVGRRVALRYEEKVGLPGRCFGDTRFYVTKVSPFPDAGEAPSAPR